MSVQNTSGLNDYPVPIGSVFAYAGDLKAENFEFGQRGSKWLVCDGQAWRQDWFPELYAVIGNIWRPAFDPNPVFYLPNLSPKTSPAEGSRVGLYISAVDDNVGVSSANIGNTGTATLNFPIAVNNLPDFTLSETRGAGDTLQGTWTDTSPYQVLLVDNTGAEATTNGEYDNICLPKGSGSAQGIVATQSQPVWTLPNPAQTNVNSVLALTTLKPPRYEMVYLIKANN
jgi:microcystin-dependent protein